MNALASREVVVLDAVETLSFVCVFLTIVYFAGRSDEDAFEGALVPVVVGVANQTASIEVEDFAVFDFDELAGSGEEEIGVQTIAELALVFLVAEKTAFQALGPCFFN